MVETFAGIAVVTLCQSRSYPAMLRFNWYTSNDKVILLERWPEAQGLTLQSVSSLIWPGAGIYRVKKTQLLRPSSPPCSGHISSGNAPEMNGVHNHVARIAHETMIARVASLTNQSCNIMPSKTARTKSLSGG